MAQYVNAELANKSNRDEGWGEKTTCFITGKPEIKTNNKMRNRKTWNKEARRRKREG